jgi:hypothetical protein
VSTKTKIGVTFKVGDSFRHTEFNTLYTITSKSEHTYKLSRPDSDSISTMGGEHIQQMITFQRWKQEK